MRERERDREKERERERERERGGGGGGKMSFENNKTFLPLQIRDLKFMCKKFYNVGRTCKDILRQKKKRQREREDKRTAIDRVNTNLVSTEAPFGK